jgi:hypothetical protein
LLDLPARPRASIAVNGSAAPNGHTGRARLDPIEFAEQLRIALIDDARRQGIEV